MAVSFGCTPTVGTMKNYADSRLDIARMRRERIERARDALKKSGLGAILCFNYENMMYLGSWPKQTWERADNSNYILLTKEDEPIYWQYGTRSPELRNYMTWKDPKNIRPAMTLDFACHGTGDNAAEAPEGASFFGGLKEALEERGFDFDKDVLGIDRPQSTVFIAKMFEDQGIKVADAWDVMMSARVIKTEDEVLCMNLAAAVTEAGHQAYKETIRPGIREVDCVAAAISAEMRAGCMFPEAQVFVSGEQGNRNQLNFTDRLLRPGELVMADPNGPMFMGYCSCYYRTYCVGKANNYQKELYAQVMEMMDKVENALRPGVSDLEISHIFPPYEFWRDNYGSRNMFEPTEVACCHGLGLGLHEPPFAGTATIIHKDTYAKNMTGAVEFWLGHDNPTEGVKVEDMYLITDDGMELLSKWPRDQITECLN